MRRREDLLQPDFQCSRLELNSLTVLTPLQPPLRIDVTLRVPSPTGSCFTTKRNFPNDGLRRRWNNLLHPFSNTRRRTRSVGECSWVPQVLCNPKCGGGDEDGRVEWRPLLIGILKGSLRPTQQTGPTTTPFFLWSR